MLDLEWSRIFPHGFESRWIEFFEDHFCLHFLFLSSHPQFSVPTLTYYFKQNLLVSLFEKKKKPNKKKKKKKKHTKKKIKYKKTLKKKHDS